MENKFHGNLTVSSAPHLVGPISTQRIMAIVLIALIPAFISGFIYLVFRKK